MSDTILYEVKDRIAVVTFNRPERLNAINGEMQAAMVEALERAEADEGVHAVLLQGSGRAFSAGADAQRDQASGLATPLSLPQNRDRIEAGLKAFLRIWDLRIPVIAKVHGYCLGRATQLAAICDISYVAEDAVVGAPQVPLGAGFNSVFSAWFVGPKKAKELFFPVGAKITGREAADMGLFNAAVPADQLDSYVWSYVRKLAAAPRDVMGLQKLAVNRTQEVQGFREALAFGVEVDVIAQESPTIKEIQRQIRERGLQAVLADQRAREEGRA